MNKAKVISGLRATLLGGCMIWSITSSAAAITLPEVVNPSPEAARIYQEEAVRIEQLLAQALNTQLRTEERMEALIELLTNYLDYAVAIGGKLVDDENSEIATFTIGSLADVIAMDHSPSLHSTAGTLHGMYLIARRDKILEIIRHAIDDPRSAVYGDAASILASRGDPQGLDLIEEAASEGRIKDVDAIRYYSLASQIAAATYLEKYWKSGSPEARNAASAHLAYNPKYMNALRDEALQPDADEGFVKAVLPGLGATDSAYNSYGFALVHDATRSKALREQAIEAAVAATVPRLQSTAVREAVADRLEHVAKEIESDRAMMSVRDLRSATVKVGGDI